MHDEHHRPAGSIRFDLWMALLTGWFTAGFFIDAYAHHHDAPESFFTPWHAILYSGFLASAGFAWYTAWRNRAPGRSWLKAVPAGYETSLVGSLIFLADGRGQLRLSYAAGADDSAPPWSPDGERVLFMSDTGEGYGLWLMNADGTARTLLAERQAAEFYQPAWSPDGRHIAFTLLGDQGAGHEHQHDDGDRGRDAHLWIMRADGNDQRPLTQGERRDWNAAWSPDGNQLAFMSTVAGNTDLNSTPLGGGEPARLTDHPAEDGHPSWSADGQRLAFESDRDGDYGIFVMPAEGGEARRLGDAEREAWSPSWSPDGQAIAFNAASESGDVEIWSMKADGSEPRMLSDRPAAHDGFFNWSPDSRQIVFRSRPDAQGNRAYLSQAVGSLGIIVHTAILMGGLLLALSRWRIPSGGLLLVIGLNSFGMALLEDEWRLIAVGLIGGLIAEILYRWLFSGPSDRHAAASLDSPGRFRVFAFLVPASLFAVYQIWLLATEGLGWSVHMWTGSIIIAGLVGLLISILVGGPVGRNSDAVQAGP